jgi:predicted O-methyltransferase YrrM
MMQHFYQNIGQNWFTYPNLYARVVAEFTEGSHFVEVGSWKGRSAAFMAVEIHNSGKKIKFDCIDTWEGSAEHTDPTLPSYEPLLEVKDGLYNDFLKNISPVKHIINPVKMTSVEASNLYKDSSLDFVFIDAAHDYDNVLLDISNWSKKVKVGGILSGHDYSWSEDVKRAVHTFFKEDEIEESEGCWIKRI